MQHRRRIPIRIQTPIQSSGTAAVMVTVTVTAEDLGSRIPVPDHGSRFRFAVLDRGLRIEVAVKG